MLIKEQVSKAEAGALPCHMPAAKARGWPCGIGDVICILVRKGRVLQSICVSSKRGKGSLLRSLQGSLTGL